LIKKEQKRQSKQGQNKPIRKQKTNYKNYSYKESAFFTTIPSK